MPENAKILNRDYGLQIQIIGMKNSNRALSGDIVAVKLLKETGELSFVIL